MKLRNYWLRRVYEAVKAGPLPVWEIPDAIGGGPVSWCVSLVGELGALGFVRTNEHNMIEAHPEKKPAGGVTVKIGPVGWRERVRTLNELAARHFPTTDPESVLRQWASFDPSSGYATWVLLPPIGVDPEDIRGADPDTIGENRVALRHHAGDTEIAAAHRALPTSGKMRRRVFDAIYAVCAAGGAGLTCKEIATKFDRPMHTVSGRITELRKAGWIEDSGARTGGGIVWKTTGTAVLAVADEQRPES